MTAPSPKSPFTGNFNGAHFVRWLRETTTWAIRLYWDIFVGLPATAITLGFALIATIVGFADIVRNPAHYITDLSVIGFGVAFLISHRFRVFIWSLLGFSVLWVVLLAIVLLPLFGPGYIARSAAARLLLEATDFLPPIIAALYIDYATYRKPSPARLT